MNTFLFIQKCVQPAKDGDQLLIVPPFVDKIDGNGCGSYADTGRVPMGTPYEGEDRSAWFFINHSERCRLWLEVTVVHIDVSSSSSLMSLVESIRAC